MSSGLVLCAFAVLLAVGSAALPVPFLQHHAAETGLPVPAATATDALEGTMTGPWTLACDPGCNRQVSQSSDPPGNEVAVAIDPSNPNRILAGSLIYPPNYVGGWTSAAYMSADGGKTWTTSFPFPSQPLVVSNFNAPWFVDPVPTFGLDGTAYMIGLHLGSGDRHVVGARSTDGTLWSPMTDPLPTSQDKPWIATDPATGRLYATGRAECPCFSYSDNGGTTWTPVNLPTPLDGNGGGPSFPVAEADVFGNVYVSRRTDTGVTVSASTDHGQTFASPAVVGTIPSRRCDNTDVQCRSKGLANPNDRLEYPDPAVASNTGAALLAWESNGEIRYSRLASPGSSWSGPLTLPGGDGRRFNPTAAASPNGGFHLAWLEGVDSGMEGRVGVNALYAHSDDGSVFDAPIQLNDELIVTPLSRNHEGQPFLGHYIGIDATDDTAIVVWPDTRNGRSEIFAAFLSPEA